MFQFNRLTRLTALALLPVLAGPAWSAPAAPTDAGAPMTDTRTVDVSPGWASPQLARAAAASGRALIEQLRSARAFLASDSPELAQSALRVASEFAGAWQRTMPFVDVNDAIANASNQLVADDDTVFYDDLLPIYASLDEMDAYAPVVARQARGGVKHAEAQARAGRADAARSTLQEVGESLRATTVYLPLNRVADQIHVAQAALAAQPADTTAAVQAVDRALGSIFEVVHGVNVVRTAR